MKEAAFDAHVVAEGLWKDVGDRAIERDAKPVGLSRRLGLFIGVPESAGLGDRSPEGLTVPVKLWPLKDVWGEDVPDTAGLDEAEAGPLTLPRGLELSTDVPETAGLGDTRPEGLIAALPLCIAVEVPCGEGVRDCVELPDAEEDPVAVEAPLKLPTGVPEELWLMEKGSEGETVPVVLTPLNEATEEPLADPLPEPETEEDSVELSDTEYVIDGVELNEAVTVGH